MKKSALLVALALVTVSSSVFAQTNEVTALDRVAKKLELNAQTSFMYGWILPSARTFFVIRGNTFSEAAMIVRSDLESTLSLPGQNGPRAEITKMRNAAEKFDLMAAEKDRLAILEPSNAQFHSGSAASLRYAASELRRLADRAE